ncbi:hypothetical protein EYF80_016830 [Liparis tanakae]|uniref:Uncharacterized protein n=1 Tax=Liparis tanakae TaxID=230148 RepID=A0A4Z2I555_9TELE|nr:hypothetical protein EYF80_016830 [Liparis tanakae]
MLRGGAESEPVEKSFPLHHAALDSLPLKTAQLGRIGAGSPLVGSRERDKDELQAHCVFVMMMVATGCSSIRTEAARHGDRRQNCLIPLSGAR